MTEANVTYVNKWSNASKKTPGAGDKILVYRPRSDALLRTLVTEVTFTATGGTKASKVVTSHGLLKLDDLWMVDTLPDFSNPSVLGE